jgi:hypothetical protein
MRYRSPISVPLGNDVKSRLANVLECERLCVMATALPEDLPLRLIELLRAQGVATLEGWVALGRRRRQIFGVTRATVAQLDALAKDTSRPKR